AIEKKKIRYSVNVGVQFGDLFIVREGECRTQPSGQRKRQVLVRCSCGSERWMTKASIARQKEHKCKHRPKFDKGKTNPGDVFDCLTVVELFRVQSCFYARCK